MRYETAESERRADEARLRKQFEWEAQGGDPKAVVCQKHCSVCEGLDHHWLPESDDEVNEGEPFMVCKHCSATRPMLDSDGDDE